MLDPADAAAVAERFGVSAGQVERDHLVSELLALLSEHVAEDLVFFGGTALARSHLPDGRLSEDLDLLALGRRSDLAARLDRLIPDGLRRRVGRLVLDPPLSAVRDVVHAVVRRGDLAVRIQVLAAADYPPWPCEVRALHQRYRDVPAATLAVPTRAAFAAWKTATWLNRRAPRDLWDLWALADLGGIDAEARDLFVRHGPTSQPPARWMFDAVPDEEHWRTSLSSQTRLAVAAAEAAAIVADAWDAART